MANDEPEIMCSLILIQDLDWARVLLHHGTMSWYDITKTGIM